MATDEWLRMYRVIENFTAPASPAQPPNNFICPWTWADGWDKLGLYHVTNLKSNLLCSRIKLLVTCGHSMDAFYEKLNRPFYVTVFVSQTVNKLKKIKIYNAKILFRSIYNQF